MVRGERKGSAAAPPPPAGRYQLRSAPNSCSAEARGAAHTMPKPSTEQAATTRAAGAGKRKSAPQDLAPLAASHKQAKPSTARYRLRSSSLPGGAEQPAYAAATPNVDQAAAQRAAASAASTPPSARGRDPTVAATWDDLPIHLLKAVCQYLDPPSVLRARATCRALREACGGMPVVLRATLPLSGRPINSIIIQEIWEKRVKQLARSLKAGKLVAAELQVRVDPDEWKEVPAEASSAAMEANPYVAQTVSHIKPMLGALVKLRPLPSQASASQITRLDLQLPATEQVLVALDAALPGVTSLRLTNLIPAPHNHLAALVPERAAGSSAGRGRLFAKVTSLDICATAWDQLQHLAPLTGLTDLVVRYSMWNIPEFQTWISQLTQLTSVSFQVVDPRAKLQLDFLNFATSLPKLQHLSASVVLARTCPDEVEPGYPGLLFLRTCCNLRSLRLTCLVPDDAVRTVQGHLKNLSAAPAGCKVDVKVLAQRLCRDVTAKTAGSATAHLVPAPGVPLPQQSDAAAFAAQRSVQWGCLALNLAEADLRSVTFGGYGTPLRVVPCLRVANLAWLHISDAALGPEDFEALSCCVTLEHLFVSFVYSPPNTDQAQRGGAAAAAAGTSSGRYAAAAGQPCQPRAQPPLPTWHLEIKEEDDEEDDEEEAAAAAAATEATSGGSRDSETFILSPLLALRRLQDFEIKEQPMEFVMARLREAARARHESVLLSRPAFLVPAPPDGASLADHARHLRAAQEQMDTAIFHPQGPLLPYSYNDFALFCRQMGAKTPSLRALSVQLLDQPAGLSPSDVDRRAAGLRALPPLNRCSHLRLALGGQLYGHGEVRPAAWPKEEWMMR